MKKRHGSIALLALLIGSTTTFASDLYIQGSIGKTEAGIDSIRGVSIDESDTGFSLGVGYKVTDLIAIEGGYRDLGEYKLSATGSVTGTYLGKPFTASGTVGVAADAAGFYLGADYSLPVTDKISAHLKAGLFKWESDITGSGSGSLTYDGTTYASGASLSGSEDGTDLYL
ncbi:MAG: outer membrane beta-barrel protein, partial [Sedimenticola sp.]